MATTLQELRQATPQDIQNNTDVGKMLVKLGGQAFVTGQYPSGYSDFNSYKNYLINENLGLRRMEEGSLPVVRSIDRYINWNNPNNPQDQKAAFGQRDIALKELDEMAKGYTDLGIDPNSILGGYYDQLGATPGGGQTSAQTAEALAKSGGQNSNYNNLNTNTPQTTETNATGANNGSQLTIDALLNDPRVKDDITGVNGTNMAKWLQGNASLLPKLAQLGYSATDLINEAYSWTRNNRSAFSGDMTVLERSKNSPAGQVVEQKKTNEEIAGAKEQTPTITPWTDQTKTVKERVDLTPNELVANDAFINGAYQAYLNRDASATELALLKNASVGDVKKAVMAGINSASSKIEQEKTPDSALNLQAQDNFNALNKASEEAKKDETTRLSSQKTLQEKLDELQGELDNLIKSNGTLSDDDLLKLETSDKTTAVELYNELLNNPDIKLMSNQLVDLQTQMKVLNAEELTFEDTIRQEVSGEASEAYIQAKTADRAKSLYPKKIALQAQIDGLQAKLITEKEIAINLLNYSLADREFALSATTAKLNQQQLLQNINQQNIKDVTPTIANSLTGVVADDEELLKNIADYYGIDEVALKSSVLGYKQEQEKSALETEAAKLSIEQAKKPKLTPYSYQGVTKWYDENGKLVKTEGSSTGGSSGSSGSTTTKTTMEDKVNQYFTANMGGDKKVSPDDWLAAKNAWIEDGGNPTTFDTKFKGWKNPSNSNYK